MTETKSECERDPLTPVTVTLYVPGEVAVVVEKVITVGVDLLDETVTVARLGDTVGPFGYTVAVRLTGPEKPETPDREIVYLPDAPAVSVRELGLLTITKSRMVTVTITEWDNVPADPVTVMA